MNRRFWMLLHRVNGLLLALFLTLVGLTGSALAFQNALDRFFAPELFKIPAHLTGAKLIDPLSIVESVQLRHPGFEISLITLRHETDWPIVISLRERDGGRDSWFKDSFQLTVTADPFSGAILGERREGDLAGGWKNAAPFVARLHESLALGNFGTLCLGLAALLWTVDCFVGLYLTFPANTARAGQSTAFRIGRWPARWLPAWLIRLTQRPYKRLYDLHRAPGLWLWLCLLVFAWTGVAFNLPAAYAPVMRLFGSLPGPDESLVSHCSAQASNLDWQSAHRTAIRLFAQDVKGVHVKREEYIRYDAARCLFTYRVETDQDIAGVPGTYIVFGAGDTRAAAVITDKAKSHADQVSSWLFLFHEAELFGTAGQVLVCLSGLATALLSITGVWLYLRKRA